MNMLLSSIRCSSSFPCRSSFSALNASTILNTFKRSSPLPSSRLQIRQYLTSGPTTRTLVLHPVLKDKYDKLSISRAAFDAEEAVGLVRALYWDVVQGPLHEASEAAPSAEADTREIGSEDFSEDVSMTSELLRSVMVPVRSISAATYLGKGKISSLGLFLREARVDVVFVNTILSPVQQRNLEAAWNSSNQQQQQQQQQRGAETNRIRVLDRFAVILEIFSTRAESREAKLQVELAVLAYQKSRLVRGKTSEKFGGTGSAGDEHMEVVSGRTRGGFGFLGGAGETQLEIEKRLIEDRETRLKKELIQVVRTREIQRKHREDSMTKSTALVALVGYTNAGKTALMNRLTGSELESNDMVFQTLSTTIRKLKVGQSQIGMLLDTVGFISELPHELVASFKATLEEVLSADLLIHVTDISNPEHEYQRSSVFTVLKEIGLSEDMLKDRVIEVWNKSDLLHPKRLNHLLTRARYPVIPISALEGKNCDKLLRVIEDRLSELSFKQSVILHIPVQDASRSLQWLYRHASDVSPDYSANHHPWVLVHATLVHGALRHLQKQFPTVRITWGEGETVRSSDAELEELKRRETLDSESRERLKQRLASLKKR